MKIDSLRFKFADEINMFIFQTLFILCILLPSSVKSIDLLPTNWKLLKTVNDSLVRNLQGCKWTYATSKINITEIDTEDMFAIKRFPPSARELKTFNSFPPSLSSSNKEFESELKKHGYGYDKLGQETNVRWMIHPDHPGQNRNTCITTSFMLSRAASPLDLYSQFKRVSYRPFYLLYKKKAVIHSTGSVITNCGYFQGYEGCETRQEEFFQNVIEKCTKIFNGSVNVMIESLFAQSVDTTASQDKAYRNLEICMNEEGKSNATNPLFIATHRKRVFVISSLWDSNYHHFIADSLSRLSRHLSFLQSNPDIFIHIRGFEHDDIQTVRTEQYIRTAVKIRSDLMRILDLDPSRLVLGITVADEVFIPRAPSCGFALANSMELRLIGKLILAGARRMCPSGDTTLSSHPTFNSTRKNLVIQQRYHKTESDRDWTNNTFQAAGVNFAQHFPDHNIVKHSSLDLDVPGFNLACQILEYAAADVLVGPHGAGLTNMLFMAPGALIVEVIGEVLELHMTICGYTGPLTASLGHHHYMHVYDVYKGHKFRSDLAAFEARKMYRAVHKQAKLLNKVLV